MQEIGLGLQTGLGKINRKNWLLAGHGKSLYYLRK